MNNNMYQPGDKFRVTRQVVQRYAESPFKYGQLEVNHVLEVSRQTQSGDVHFYHTRPFYAVCIHNEDLHLLERA